MDRQKIGNRLIEVGIYPSLCGFDHIIDAVMVYDSSSVKMGDIYKCISNKGHDSEANIERRIRHAKETSKQYKSYTNREFLSLLRWDLCKDESSEQ